jgi:hypothetical protein
MIKTKAKELSNSYAISSSSSENSENLKFSDGWLDGFKKRHGIKLSNREQSKKKENSDQSDNNSQPNLPLVKFE